MNFFTSDGARLAYRVDGPEDAPPLVLINSLGLDCSMWDPQIALLSQNWRVVRYDCRGHGLSAVSPGPYTLEQLGEDLLALLETLRIEMAVICGLSLGGITALWCAVYHPEHIAAMILAHTAARIGTVESWGTRIAAVDAGGMEAVHPTALGRFLSADFRHHNPEITRHISNCLLSTNPAGYSAACAALRTADLRPFLSTIHIPSLIIAGEWDEATPPILSHQLHAGLADSQLVIIPQTSHLSNVEQPTAFNQALSSFLDTVRR